MRPIAICALLSMTLVSLEVVWTRVFAAEYFYTFAFLVVSLAVLGLGLGALTLRLFGRKGRLDPLGPLTLLTALFALGAPIAMLHLGLDFRQLLASGKMVALLVAALFLLGAPFFTGGIVLAKLFRDHHRDMPRLYMADLVGAGIGVILAVLLMNAAGTPAATFLVCLPAVLAAAAVGGRWRAAALLPLIALIALTGWGGDLLTPPRQERAPLLDTHWDAMGKIKILETSEQVHHINIDNAANSPVIQFDGNWDRPDSMRFEPGIPVKYLIERFENCRFLSLGAGGGGDVLQALQEGCTEIHAVEVNPAINRMMLEGDLAEFSGRIYHDPRVRVVTEDARTYVRRFENHFDIIYSLSSNTFAALASGSFALAEDYLFTTEAFEDYYRALSPTGFLSMEHQFYAPRLVSELKDALTNLGVEDPLEHFAVYDLPAMRRKLLLVSKAPLSDEIRQNAYVELTDEVYPYIHLLYPAPDSTANNMVNRIVLDGWQAVQDTAKIALSPCTDDRPFTAQLGLWENLKLGEQEQLTPYEFFGFPISRLIVTTILLVALVLGVPLMLLPALLRGERLRPVPWLYFFLLGLAYMAVEIVLIGRYTLLIGASGYTFATILLTLLVASGIGSRFSERFQGQLPFVLIAAWIVLEILVFPHVARALSGWTMGPRIAATVLLLFPLGFFMGMPFPKGVRRVGELVDWGFAVNGVASLVGSSAILLVAFAGGFRLALIVALGLYLLAMLLYRRRTAW